MASGFEQLLMLLRGQPIMGVGAGQPQGGPLPDPRMPQQGSALNFLSAIPVPSTSAGALSPTEAAAIAASAAAPTKDQGAGEAEGIFGAIKKLAEPEKEGGLAPIQQLFKALGATSTQNAGLASGAMATEAAKRTAAEAAANLPETQGPPIPPGGTFGPAVPSAADYVRDEMRRQMGMPGGLPPSGSAQPGTLPTVPTADPMEPGAYPVSSAPRPGSVVGTPPGRGMADRDQPYTGEPQATVWDAIRSAIKPESAAAALLEGNIGESMKRWGRSATGRDPVTGEKPGTPATPAAAGATPAGPAPAFSLRFPSAAQSGDTTKSFTIDPGSGSVTSGRSEAAPSGGGSSSAQLLREFEGYRDTPYWDVNHWRVGYGSDTITDPKTGKVSVTTKGASVDRAAAEADLERRIGLIEKDSAAQVKGWENLPDNVKAGLNSVAYNYGSLPKTVIAAANTGDASQIAEAVRGLAGHNEGVNAKRRNREADIIAGKASAPAGGSTTASGYPERTPREVFQYGEPPAQQMPVGVDMTKAREWMEKAAPKETEKLTTAFKIAQLLGGMAAGAGQASGSDWGRVIAGAGGGAAGAVGRIVGTERGDTESFRTASQRYAGDMARTEQTIATQESNVENARRQTTFENQKALYDVAVKNSVLSTEEKNAAAEYKDKINWATYQEGKPQVHTNQNGFTVIQKTPDGKINVKSTNFKDFDNQLKQIKTMEDVLGPTNPQVQGLKAQFAADNGGELGVRRMMLTDAVRGGQLPGLIGETNFKALKESVDKTIPNAKILETTKTEDYLEQFNERAVNMLQEKMLSDDPKQRLGDDWIIKLAKMGHPAAMAMVRASGRAE